METMKGKHMIDTNRRVYVYFNLHKKIWSVRQGNLIVLHTNRIALRDVRFLVGQKGRLKVLETKTKNVHAGVSGYVVDRLPNVPETAFDVTYNPYKYDTFVSKDENLMPVYHADYAFLQCGKNWRNVEAIYEKIKV